MSLSRLKALHVGGCCWRCRPPRPGNHFRLPHLASQALAPGTKDRKSWQHERFPAEADLVACSSAGASPSSSGSSSPAAAAAVKTATIAGVTVPTNSKGFTLYPFAPDTPARSKCNGTCAQNWPPVTGPVTAASVTGTFGTIKRSDGSVQATFDGHPLYTFAGDTAPGQAKGNGLNAAGGLWHEITTSGTAAPAPAGGSSSGSGGYGY
jgi:predicted lipoprotein with Yx(FWY)xxD motif